MRCAYVVIGLLSLVVGVAGCDAFFDPTAVLGGGMGNVPAERIEEVEPNDTFEAVSQVPAAYATMLDVAGFMTNIDDIDIYDLGPVVAGDRITVSVDSERSANLAAALFDDQHCLFVCNDDRYWQVDPRPQLGLTVRRDSAHCYLVIAPDPAVRECRGSYTATVLLERGTVPAPRPQTVYLSFHGAKRIAMPGRNAVDIPAFDAAFIDSSFAGRTAEMIEAIVANVRSHYAMFNVNILSSTESSVIPTDATIVYFGTYDPNYLGLADSVDRYNADLTQKAIVFTDTFSMFMPLQPSLSQMALAIANVASHEAGHLLGLEHTRQWTDLMDTTGPAQTLLTMQAFETAPLYEEVFPIGWQDGVLQLAETVGVRQVPAGSRIDRHLDFANTTVAAESGLSVITGDVPASFQHASRAAEVSPEIWWLLLYGQGSAQDDISKDCFAVHSRRNAVR